MGTPKKKARGAVKTIESNGIKIPIYSALTPSGSEGYLLSYYANGRRVQQRAATLATAVDAAKAKIRELTTGAAHVGSLTPRQTAVVADAIEILRPTGVSLSEAARQFVEAHTILAGQGSLADAARLYAQDVNKRKIPRRTVSQVVAEFRAELEVSGLSELYRRDARIRLGRAAEAFKTQIADVMPDSIVAWLSQGKRSPRSYNNDRNALVTLWRWAKKKGYLPEGIATAPERTPKRKDVGSEIQILTPENFALLLKNTPTTFLPYVAIGGLAGVRTAEISRLDWSEVHMAERHILISAAKAKTASRRIVPICDALAAWLKPLVKSDGPIMPFANEQSMLNQWSRAKARMVGADNKPLVEVPTNALRHSYASYRLAQVEDAAKVSLEMGNSPRKLFQNYRQLVTKAQAKKWFAVVPSL